ncbi:MAG: CocE/NonD family hydrolase [Actinobacteria bacterium]|nr:CocE/NonD family hydrolase [Actinomycetota bacterium]
MTPIPRLTDRALSALLGLGPPTCAHTITREVSVAMRDGVPLLADHYAPITAEPAGTILVRGPYGRGGPAALSARLYAAHGYHVVIQSTRGTFGSGGEFAPGRTEVDDGADTVAWLRGQPWFTGSFATIGSSYLGFTQWALLVDPPPELAAAVITVGPHDLSATIWDSGAFALSDFLGWSDAVARQEDPRTTRRLLRSAAARWRVRPALNGLPLGAAGRALLGDGAPWYESWLAHPETRDEFWAPTRLHAALERARIPVLLTTGWQDVFLTQTLEQYERLHARGVDVALTVGPWTHMQIGVQGARRNGREARRWLAAHLSGRPGRRAGRVSVFVTGARCWRELSQWPPPCDDTELFLWPGSILADRPPWPGAAPSRFVYDPADPTPTVGGRLLSPESGYRTGRRLSARPDVLNFTGARLAADVEIAGTPIVELHHTTDIPHADVFVRLGEADDAGRIRNVSDGYLRLGAERVAPLRLRLDPVAHRFRAGRRICLLVAGGSHPRFARNLGTGEPALTGSGARPSTHTVAHGAGGVSRLVLPVLSAG